VLHFFTHGLRDPELERPAGLLLAADGIHGGRLWCGQAEDLAVPPLVVLSVCGAGRGPVREGSGPVTHLGGAFLFAGADAVVHSHSDLYELPTLALMEVLHARLAAGDSPAEALRRARCALVEGGEWTDPYYHGLLRVIGLAHRPVFSAPAEAARPGTTPAGEAASPSRGWIVGLGLGLVVVVAAALVLRGRRRARATT
jgi:hypothetical protein